MKKILLKNNVLSQISDYTWFIVFGTIGVLIIFIFLLSQKKKKDLLKHTSEPMDQEVDTSYACLVVLGSVTYENRNYFSFLLKKRVYVKRVERLLDEGYRAYFKVFFFEKENPESFYVLEIMNQYSIKDLSKKEKQILKSKFFEFEYYNQNVQIIVDEHAQRRSYIPGQSWHISKEEKPFLKRVEIG